MINKRLHKMTKCTLFAESPAYSSKLSPVDAVEYPGRVG